MILLEVETVGEIRPRMDKKSARRKAPRFMYGNQPDQSLCCLHALSHVILLATVSIFGVTGLPICVFCEFRHSSRACKSRDAKRRSFEILRYRRRVSLAEGYNTVD